MSISTVRDTRFSTRCVGALVTIVLSIAALSGVPQAQAASSHPLNGLSSSLLSANSFVPPQTTPAQPQPQPQSNTQGLPYRNRAQAIIHFTNVKRAQHGLAPISENVELSRVIAQPWADRMKRENTLYHRTRHWEAYPAHIPAGGENLLQAWSDYSDEQLVELWYNSPGHRANMLDPRATSVGIGVAIAGDGKLYAVQNFAR